MTEYNPYANDSAIDLLNLIEGQLEDVADEHMFSPNIAAHGELRDRINTMEAEIARLRAALAEVEADAATLACEVLVTERLCGAAENICPQPTREQVDAAVRRAEQRAEAKRRT